MLNAKNEAIKDPPGSMMFRPPPSIIPGEAIADAIAMSSAVSPEEGVMTSVPQLKTDPGTGSENVSTLSIIVL